MVLDQEWGKELQAAPDLKQGLAVTAFSTTWYTNMDINTHTCIIYAMLAVAVLPRHDT